MRGSLGLGLLLAAATIGLSLAQASPDVRPRLQRERKDKELPLLPDGEALSIGAWVAFRSAKSRYLVAEDTGDLRADRDLVRAWESFRVGDRKGAFSGGPLRFGDTIVLSTFHRRYVVADTNGEAGADRPLPREWEQWTLVDPTDGASREEIRCGENVALRAWMGKFLSAAAGGQVEVKKRPAPVANDVWTVRCVKNVTAAKK